METAMIDWLRAIVKAHRMAVKENKFWDDWERFMNA
jgi:hypothetical protein